MMEFWQEYWVSFMLVVAATSFGWNFFQGRRDGITRIPVKRFSDDEYERGTTMFGLA
jgi:hypothetical protein